MYNISLHKLSKKLFAATLTEQNDINAFWLHFISWHIVRSVKGGKAVKNLSELERDENCRVERLSLAGDMTRRLMDLGFTKGAKVTCVLCGSGIKAYLVRGAVIALRNEDSDKVQVSEIN